MPYAIESSGRILIDIRLNDTGPFRFAIDTAATGSFIFTGARHRLGLEPDDSILVTVHGAVARGTFPIVTIDRLGIGDEQWSGVRLVTLPGDTLATETLDGVLGADFLRRYSIALSSADRSLRLYRPESVGDRNYRGWTPIPLDPRPVGAAQEPLRYLEIEVAGRRVPALLDLGAGVSVLNSAAARALQLAAVRAGRTEAISGAIGSSSVTARLGTHTVRTAGVSWHNEVFLIADLEIFSTLESTDRPLAILGSGLFSQRDLILDLARDRLLIRSGMDEIES